MGVILRDSRFRRRTLRGLVAAAALALGAAPTPASANLRCDQIPELLDAFLKYHVQYRRRTEELENRAVEVYLKRLDPSRTLYLQSEVDALKVSMADVFEEIEAGNCDRLLAAHKNLRAHHKTATEKVRETVSAEGFKLDESVSWVLDPDERGYPKTEARSCARSPLTWSASMERDWSRRSVSRTPMRSPCADPRPASSASSEFRS